MKHYTKVIALALIAAMLLPACAQGDTTTPDDTSASADTTTGAAADTAAPADTKDPRDVDDLPADLNFDDATLSFFTRNLETMVNGILTVEESTGDTLNDIIWERQEHVSDALGLVLEEYTSATLGNQDEALTALRAGDNSWKMLQLRCVYGVQMASQGYAYSWDKVDHVDLDKNYWYESINNELTFGDKTYFAAGAYNLTSYDFTHVILFNKELVNAHNLENPYDLVKNGTWTFDKFTEYAKAHLQDINNDGVMNDQDNYGYLSGAKQIPPSFWIAAGQLGIKRDGDGYPRFTMHEDEPFLDVMNRIYDIMYDDAIWFVEVSDDNIPASSTQIFSENRAMMMGATFFAIENLREMEADFGFLPYPKYTEEQENYLSRIEGCELPIINIACSQAEADMVGAFLEKMSSYSHAYTIPAYDEIYLKTRNARDAESAEIIDLVFANRVFDLSDTIWCDEVRDGFIKTIFKANNRSFVATAKKGSNSINKAIDKVMEGFADLK